MSASISINPELDASIGLQSTTHYDINGSQVTFRTYPATSWSNNAIKFSIIPPSMDVYVNRSLMVTTPITITYTGTTTSPSALLLDSGYDALRSLAGSRIIRTLNVNINGISVPVTSFYDTYVEPLLHYDEDYRKKHPLGAIDVTQVYSDSIGAVNNPLTDYSTSESFDEGQGIKRGAFTLRSVTRGATSAVLVLDLIDWIYVPGLFGANCSEEFGLTRIRNIDIDQTIDLSAPNVVSHALTGYSTITATTVALTGQPSILAKFISIPHDMIPHGNLNYPHLRMERYVTQLGGTLAPNVSNVITSNNIQVPYIPRYMWVFVREQDASKLISSPDTFCALTNLSIQFNNQSALLSSASPYQLWEMSRNTNLQDSLIAWNGISTNPGFAQIGTVGSIGCFEFGRQISLGDPNLAIGTAGQFNLSVQATFKNVNQVITMTNPTLYLVVAYDEIMTIQDGGLVTFVTPTVPVGTIAAGVDMVKVPYNVSGLTGITRGGSAKSFFKGIGKFLKSSKVLSTVGKALLPALIGPAGVPISEAVSQLGYGDGGAVITGGAEMTQQQLRAKIRKM